MGFIFSTATESRIADLARHRHKGQIIRGRSSFWDLTQIVSVHYFHPTSSSPNPLPALSFKMWDDQPIQRKPPVDIPPSTRAFLSQFNRSFTPPALINDPYAVDRKLTITPLLLGARPLYVPRNPFAVDPAVERVRHYVGSEGVVDQELRPSPVLAAELDTEWGSDDEDFAAAEKDQPSVSPARRLSDALGSKRRKQGHGECQCLHQDTEQERHRKIGRPIRRG